MWILISNQLSVSKNMKNKVNYLSSVTLGEQKSQVITFGQEERVMGLRIRVVAFHLR